MERAELYECDYISASDALPFSILHPFVSAENQKIRKQREIRSQTPKPLSTCPSFASRVRMSPVMQVEFIITSTPYHSRFSPHIAIFGTTLTCVCEASKNQRKQRNAILKLQELVGMSLWCIRVFRGLFAQADLILSNECNSRANHAYCPAPSAHFENSHSLFLQPSIWIIRI